MGCALIIDPDGTRSHICGPGVKHCVACTLIAEYQCDWPMGKEKTCDAHLCERHAIPQGRLPSTQLMLFEPDEPGESDLHFCPAHEAIARRGVIPATRSS
jgi:hypothetical protein